MANITLPVTYSALDVQLTTFTYTFQQGSLSRTTNAYTDTDMSMTINSYNGRVASFTLNIVTTITRNGTNPGNWTYVGYPTITITAGAESIVIYSTSGSFVPVFNQASYLTFAPTFTYNIPTSFANKEWIVRYDYTLVESDTGKSGTGFYNVPAFTIPVILQDNDGLFFGTNF